VDSSFSLRSRTPKRLFGPNRLLSMYINALMVGRIDFRVETCRPIGLDTWRFVKS
jgi:hypothetical protein